MENRDEIRRIAREAQQRNAQESSRRAAEQAQREQEHARYLAQLALQREEEERERPEQLLTWMREKVDHRVREAAEKGKTSARVVETSGPDRDFPDDYIDAMRHVGQEYRSAGYGTSFDVGQGIVYGSQHDNEGIKYSDPDRTQQVLTLEIHWQ